MSKLKPKYITVPIGLLQNIHTNPTGTIKEMFEYGIYDRMRKNNPDLEHEDFESGAIEESMQYFNLIPNDSEQRLLRGRTLYDRFEGTPNASVNIDTLLAYQKEKTEFELMVFCFYCAIRSMIGTKTFWKGTDDFWIARAFGYSTLEDYQNAKPTQGEKDMRAKYSKRYWLDRIKKVLQNDWFLIYYSNHVRGYYASFKMDFKSLVNIAEDKKDLSKQKELLRKQEVQQILAERANKKNLKN